MSTAVFERYEKKYLITPSQYPLLAERLQPYFACDSYGLHTICSLYYDTPDYAVIRHSLSKPAYKEKLRLRSYGVPSAEDHVFVELKKKYQGITYKRRAAMPIADAQRLLRHGELPAGDAQTLGELAQYIRRQPLAPSALICYDRIALFGREQPGLRLTFDACIRWRETGLQLARGDYGTQLLPPGYRLMEVKTISPALPLWLVRILGELEIYPASFSKYGKVYMEHLQPGLEVRHAG